MKPVIAALAVAVMTLMAAGTASAHHSFAMFDAQKVVTVDGTVKEFQWANPHSWIELAVNDPSGKSVEWSIEGGSPSVLVREGWRKTSMKPGDKVQVTIHPMKDGTPGGSLLHASVNGQPIGGGAPVSAE
jgi:hypothetical protein